MTNERNVPRLVRRILIAQLDKSVSGLRKRPASDAAVHEVRKELKRARATLRFMRDCVGKSAYRRDNRCVRNAARPLRAVRDANVLLHTFARLMRGRDTGEAKAFRVRMTRELQRERAVSHDRLQGTLPLVSSLCAVRRRMADLSARQLHRISVSAGARRTYKAGLRAFAKVRQESTDARLHEWRKQVKFLFNQIDVIGRLSSGRFRKIRKRSQCLAEVLGRDHDLGVLHRRIMEISHAAGTTDESSALRAWSARVGGRRKALQLEARKLGGRLYAVRPQRIAGKIEDGL
jgi:CHAD domain-containing protein